MKKNLWSVYQPSIMPHVVKMQDVTDLEIPRESRVRTSSTLLVKNRRMAYLDRHPSYFDSPDLELAGERSMLISLVLTTTTCAR